MEDGILHRKERLIITAIEILDELGIQGLSTREIARRQNISEATLFRHFKSKNDLLIAVLEQFSMFDDDLFESIKLKNLSPKEAITYLIISHVEYYENYPAITAVMQVFDVLRQEPELAVKIKSIVSKQANFIKRLIEDAQMAGELKHDLNIENLCYMITGLVREICLKWRLEDRKFPLKERTLTAFSMLMNAFSII